jgi:hypothetical protein
LPPIILKIEAIAEMHISEVTEEKVASDHLHYAIPAPTAQAVYPVVEKREHLIEYE